MKTLKANPITPAELEELDRLYAEATPGQWVRPDFGRGLVSLSDGRGGWLGMIARFDCGDYARDKSEGYLNAECSAALHNAYPGLRAKITELEAERDAALSGCAEYDKLQRGITADCLQSHAERDAANARAEKAEELSAAKALDIDERFNYIRLECERRISALAARCERLRAALKPFGTGGVVKSIEREDYSIMRERLVDWHGPSDFRNAKATLAETPAQSLATIQAGALREAIDTWPNEEGGKIEHRNLIAWILSEADRIESEAANGKSDDK